MKYVKVSGLLAVAAVFLMAFAPTASATTLTWSSGIYTGTLRAEAGETTFHGVATITCKSSKLEGSVESHGSGVTASANLSSLTFSECGSNHVVVLKPGSLEVHTQNAFSNGNGTLTSSGAEISVEITSLGITCLFRTEGTHLGTITGGVAAVIDVESASLIVTTPPSSIFCGSKAKLTSSYVVSLPGVLSVD